MQGRTHVVGAGIAGLSAALALSRKGGQVTLYDASPQAGGRCRTLPARRGFAHDNGTHVLFSGNRNALRLLAEIGARESWVEPEPEGLPLHDLRVGHTRVIGLQPWTWRDPSRRPAGLGVADIGRFLRLAMPGSDIAVGRIFAGSGALESFVGPLTVAVLNTPITTASSRRLARAISRLLLPGAGRLLVARQGLSANLVDPALHTLVSRGAFLEMSRRLRALVVDGDRVTSLTTSEGTVALQPNDRLILALPPGEVERLLPGLAVPRGFQPILNVHYRTSGLPVPRLIGFTGGLAQWAIVRADHVSVTVSAAGNVLDRGADMLAHHIWSEIAPALREIGLVADASRQPEANIVTEKRATISQTAGPTPQPPIRPFSNVALAGDWIGKLPATIESAVIAGERAASAFGRPRRPSLSPILRRGSRFEGAT
jgi:uncharacterized protein with NAD-binding domain and iron-sulfur cluster